jgi:hypothetical protein
MIDSGTICAQARTLKFNQLLKMLDFKITIATGQVLSNQFHMAVLIS